MSRQLGEADRRRQNWSVWCCLMSAAAAWFALCITTVGVAQDDTEEPLPRIETLAAPTAEQLLTGKPADWVVLKTGEVLVVEPVTPSPRTIERLLQLQTEAGQKMREEKKNKAEIERRLQELNFVQVTLAEDSLDPEYRIELKYVDRIFHHEDHILAVSRAEMERGQTPIAYELLNRLSANRPDWPGLPETLDLLLFTEARMAGDAQDWPAARRKLEELFQRTPAFAGLESRYAEIVSREFELAVAAVDFRQARHYLGRLRSRFPQNAVLAARSQELLAKAEDLISQARSSTPDTATKLVDQAAIVWPEAPSLRAVHRETTARFQILELGVLHLAGSAGNYPLPLPADERVTRLTQHWLFETSRIDPSGTAYRTRFLEDWIPTQLGREMRFLLKPARADWESRPNVWGGQMVSLLRSQLDPTSPRYDERLATYLLDVTPRGPTEFHSRFRQVPLRVEGLLRIPVDVPAGETASDDRPHPGELAASTRFRRTRTGPLQQVFDRAVTPPPTARRPGIQRVIETRYLSWDAAIQALLRGQITAIPEVDPIDRIRLEEDPRFVVVPYAQPRVHILQFAPDSPARKSSALRRALLLGINRQPVLERAILGDQRPLTGRVTNGPFSQTCYAYAKNLPAPVFRPEVAATLALTAQKDFGGDLPCLRLICPPDVRTRAACRQLVDDWKKIGITAELIDDRQVSMPDSDSGSPADVSADQQADQQVDAVESRAGPPSVPVYDLIYRTVKLDEPLYDFWPFLALKAGSNIADLSAYPSWLRARLLGLEQAADWETAIRLLQQLQIDLLAEAWYIPLYEVDEYWVARRRVTELPAKLLHPYHDVERWTVQSWYPTEVP